jgi:NCAIR mutase (PurE)-related protein
MSRMSRETLSSLAQQLRLGEIDVDQFLCQIAELPGAAALSGSASADVTLDLDRERRCGFPEVVFAQGKSVEALLQIFAQFVERHIDGFATRVSAEQAAALAMGFSSGRHNVVARTFRLPATPAETAIPVAARGRVSVVTAGTSDRPVAEEACETLDWMGVDWNLIQDVGVAGPHRLRERLAEIETSDAVVVVAGMEGALPSVVGGYLACPVIAAPTSVGYGASFGGIAALLGMLNSCAANVTVVNIDAGFKAGYIAGLIASRAARRQ